MISVAIVVILISYGIYYLLAPEWFYGSRVQFPKIILSWNNTTDTFILPVPEKDISYFNESYVWKAYAINSSENGHINITLAFAPHEYNYGYHYWDELTGFIYCLAKIKDGEYLIKSIILGWKYSPEKYITRFSSRHDDTLPYFAGNIKYNWKTYLYNIYEKHMVELYPASNFTFCWTGAYFMFGIYGNEQTNWSYNITIPYTFEYTLTVYYGKSFMGFWYDVHSISTKVFVKIIPKEVRKI